MSLPQPKEKKGRTSTFFSSRNLLVRTPCADLRSVRAWAMASRLMGSDHPPIFLFSKYDSPLSLVVYTYKLPYHIHSIQSPGQLVEVRLKKRSRYFHLISKPVDVTIHVSHLMLLQCVKPHVPPIRVFGTEQPPFTGARSRPRPVLSPLLHILPCVNGPTDGIPASLLGGPLRRAPNLSSDFRRFVSEDLGVDGTRGGVDMTELWLFLSSVGV